MAASHPVSMAASALPVGWVGASVAGVVGCEGASVGCVGASVAGADVVGCVGASVTGADVVGCVGAAGVSCFGCSAAERLLCILMCFCTLL